MLISDLVTWAANQWPNKEALVDIDPATNIRLNLTFKEFDEKINKVSNALLASGIKKGDTIIHFVKNRLEWLETYFGVIRIGARIVPLNFRFTSDDIKYVCDTLNSSMMIVEEDLIDIIEPVKSDIQTITQYVVIGENAPEGMTTYADFLSDSTSDVPETDVSEEDDLGIYFTSGTTGKPKPILYTHRNLYEVAVTNGLGVPLPDNSNSVMYCPLYHTATFFFWLPNLLVGGKGTILRRFSVKDLLKTMADEKGTEINIPMPHCIALVNAQKSGEINVNDYDLSSWELINTGAQPYPPSVIADMVELLPTVGVQHGYGISEGGGAALIMLKPDMIQAKPGSCGKPTPTVSVKIVDANGDEVPVGESGEMILKSGRMMKEYYNNEEETAKTIKNGWLRTGDVTKQDDEGYFYIVDRMKDVVISGGENVYPVEVENVLQTHPKIKMCAVIGTPDEKFGERVTAVIEVEDGMELTEEEVLQFCAENFPPFKRPRRIEFADLPKGPTNKVLKPELRQRYSGKSTAF